MQEKHLGMRAQLINEGSAKLHFLSPVSRACMQLTCRA
jgi:hypothetical protein